ncbi:hypothetical protein A3839_25485 [Achromobacter insolitus]|nr:hypothetical protein A3839_25485 [Achromobacter insolitus]
MRALCRSGTVVGVYSDIVLKEVMRTYGREQRREALLRQWMPFVRATCGELKEDVVDVWRSEVIQNLKRKAKREFSSKEIRRIFERIDQAPLDGSWHIWSETQPDFEKEDEARALVHALLRDARAEGASERDTSAFIIAGAGAARLNGPFEVVVNNLGHSVIKRLTSHNPDGIAARWSTAKGQYPYFTESVRGLAYSMLESTASPNTKLDRNAFDDIKVMVQLLDADVVVSNETNFFLRAFTALWQPRGKVLMTVDQFVSHLQKMA